MRLFFGPPLGTIEGTLERAELQPNGDVFLFTRTRYGQKPIRLTSDEAHQVAAELDQEPEAALTGDESAAEGSPS